MSEEQVGKLPRWIRTGVRLLEERIGDGAVVAKGDRVRVRERMWLNRGDPVRWPIHDGAGRVAASIVADEHGNIIERGFESPPSREPRTTEVQEHELEVLRRDLVPGHFYALLGMRVGGRRLVEVAPAFAYNRRGIPGLVPPDALVRMEIEVLARIANAS